MSFKKPDSKKNKTINVSWWMFSSSYDGYADYDEDVEAFSNEEAIEKMKIKYPRGKTWKV